MVTHTTNTLKTRDGTSLFTEAWLPEGSSKGIVVVQHGLNEYGGRYDHTARYLVDHGWAVYALDARGHGHSAGNQRGYYDSLDALVDDLKAYVDSLSRQPAQAKPFLIGHSMGGLIATCYAIKYGDSLRGLVLSGAALAAGDSISPIAIQVAKIVGRFAPRLGLTTLDASIVTRNQEQLDRDKTDPLMYFGKIPARVGSEMLRAGDYARANLDKITRPILILHGGADALVSPKISPYIYEQVGSTDKTLKVYEHLYHEIFNEPEREAVLSEVAAWLDTH
jgi:acylglycerol lipase